jgi:hypothetical protein
VKLHVTNGDTAVPLIRRADEDGRIVPWRDVLHDGPVPGGTAPAQLAEVRAAYLAGTTATAQDEIRRQFAERDDLLDRAGEFDEVVLWFEHDLYDQLQLIQVLDRLSCLEPPPRALSLICRPEYLGVVPVARGPGLLRSREPVSGEMTGVARLVWGAFTAPVPSVLEAALQTDLSTLPFLRAAMLRLLEEYPWTSDGLSRMERQALEALRAGAESKQEVFRQAQLQEDRLWCGDLSFYSYLERLARGAAPLVVLEGDRVTLTDDGEAVLDGAADGIDRWLGGVHLSGAVSPWRWDPAIRSVTA